MKRTPGRMLVCILLCLSLTTGVLAADPTAMTDIRTHWARDAIYYCMAEGLFTGATDTTFRPNQTMSRGMFVTVLGRLAGIDEKDYQDWYLPYLYTDVPRSAYYAPYVLWATRMGIVSGDGNRHFNPTEPITREQLATVTFRFVSIYNYVLVSSGDAVTAAYADENQISEYARDCVENLRLTGVMGGTAAQNGTYLFKPKDHATKAQCALLMSRLTRAMRPYTERTLVDPTGIELAPAAMELHPGDVTALTATVSPADATNQTVTWFSTNNDVVTVRSGGILTAVGEGAADVYACTYNGYSRRCTVTVTANRGLSFDGETYEEKIQRIFGLPSEQVGDPRTFYNRMGIPESDYLTTITVRVWDFDGYPYTENNKITKTLNITVHKNIADSVAAVFEEIYNGPERFPIKSAGGYYSNELSEHDPGLAIDITPDSNYYCDPQGNAITGSHWDPDTDPYSIPLEGDVVKAFRKYGFTQGIYWRSGYKDYMHFSYFAT